MKNEQDEKSKQPELSRNTQAHTPIRAFRFVLQVPGIESHKVSYVRSLPGDELEIGYCVTEESEPLGVVALGGTVKMLNAQGEVVKTTAFRAGGFEWLPFQFDYRNSGNLIQRLLYSGVVYNP